MSFIFVNFYEWIRVFETKENEHKGANQFNLLCNFLLSFAFRLLCFFGCCSILAQTRLSSYECKWTIKTKNVCHEMERVNATEYFEYFLLLQTLFAQIKSHFDAFLSLSSYECVKVFHFIGQSMVRLIIA